MFSPMTEGFGEYVASTMPRRVGDTRAETPLEKAHRVRAERKAKAAEKRSDWVDEARLRKAAHVWLTSGSWKQAALEAGIRPSRLMTWDKRPTSRPGARWRAMVEKLRHELNLDGTNPKPSVELTPEFKTPEQLCDHYSMEAVKVQIETMLDPDASRRDRNDAAQKVLALGGHSPIQKSVVITAPINDKRIAALIFSGLQEVRQVTEQARILLPEFTGEAEEQVEAQAQALT